MERNGIFLCFIFITVTFHQINSQQPPVPGKSGPYDKLLNQTELSDNQDLFEFNGTQYIISSNELNWEEAKLSCLTLTTRPAQLAIVDTESVAMFLAEALSETNKLFDNLWIAGRLYTDGKWITGVGSNIQKLPEELLKKFNRTRLPVNYGTRDCLAFRRIDHQNASFLDLNCNAQRSYICERGADPSKSNITTTHPGWIKIGKRLFKIFHDRVPWENASINCFKIDKEARLAVITNFNDSQSLGRYLLIGRPSLENAWIGGKFDGTQYTFPIEDVILPNEIGKDNYPPWRPGVQRKEGGCLLLDRHLSNTTLFVEALCTRLRPYICYKFDTLEEHGKTETDFSFPEHDYRLFFNRLNWDEGNKECIGNGSLKSTLAQPKSEKDIQNILYIMGENRTSVQHIWIGARFFENEPKKWYWTVDNGTKGDEVKDRNSWIVNNTFTDDVENMNICLNFDRENHFGYLFYGADCWYPQSFICQYPPGTLVPTTGKTPGKQP